jgi:hypothetical protein
VRYIDGPLLVGPPMFVPALLALFDLRQHATEAAARRRLRLELVPDTRNARVSRVSNGLRLSGTASFSRRFARTGRTSFRAAARRSE